MRNKYEFSDDQKSCRIFFYDGSFFVIDSSDFSAVSAHTWWKGKRGYPVMKTSRKSPDGHKTIALHRFLLNPPTGFDVDHISNDKLDNRRCNLRVCTHQQNMFNQKKRCTNTSGYYGVSLLKSCGRYEAYINISGKKKYLGLYKTAEEAAEVRDREARRLYGKYAKLNFPDAA
jgi:hypothetical protein